MRMVIGDLREYLTRNAPRRDNLDVRLEAIECELKANLVVTFARASVRDVANIWIRSGAHR